MFIKLLRRDLKFLFKPLTFYITTIFIVTFIFCLTAYDHNSSTGFIRILHTFSQNAMFTFSIGAIIAIATRYWYYFRSNMYGDPSYLTHTLPARTSTIWAAKFWSSVLITLLSISSIILALLLMNHSDNFIDSLISALPNTPTFNFYFALIFGIITQLIFTTLCGTTGIIIGHRFNQHTGLFSIIASLVTYVIGVFLMFIVVSLSAYTNPELSAYIFESNTMPNLDTLIQLLYIVSGFYCLLISILYIINRQLLTKINVD